MRSVEGPVEVLIIDYEPASRIRARERLPILQRVLSGVPGRAKLPYVPSCGGSPFKTLFIVGSYARPPDRPGVSDALHSSVGGV
jgi:hypothetical protein